MSLSPVSARRWSGGKKKTRRGIEERRRRRREERVEREEKEYRERRERERSDFATTK